VALRPNLQSLVFTVTLASTAALLEADAEKAEERRIVEEHPEAQLLKVAHHGSATSTSAELLATVHPRYAVISAGVRNVYGHPRREVLERLQQAGVQTYRTDMIGVVSFYLDGKSVIPMSRLSGKSAFRHPQAAIAGVDYFGRGFGVIFADEKHDATQARKRILAYINRLQLRSDSGGFEQALHDECFRFLFGVEHLDQFFVWFGLGRGIRGVWHYVLRQNAY
jgi:hypothetical protein